MLTILAFIFTLGLLITIHEFGHFIVARFFDVKVIKFSIGFGQPIWRTTFGHDKTEFVLAAIPLGGFVKMLDEQELKQESTADIKQYSSQELARAFNRLPVLKKMAVVVSGPAANLLLAIALYAGIFMSGVVGLKPILGEIKPNTMAAMSGLLEGDEIRKINGNLVNAWQDVRWQLLNESVDDELVTLDVLSKKNGFETIQLNVRDVDHENQQQDILDQLGLTIYQPKISPIFGEILKDSPAERAGLQSGDHLIEVNQLKITDWNDFVAIVKTHPNQALFLKIQRENKIIKLEITPNSVIKNKETVGRIGANVQVNQKEFDVFLTTTHYTLFEAFVKATQKTWDTSIFSLKMMGKMFTGDISWKMMSGPVTIANYAGQSATMGLKIFVGFLALMSISIGVLNLLPIPVLDGGHLMYYMVEIFTGKPVPEKILIVGQKIGLLLIVSMTVLAFYNDINRFITG